jgi:hypothetical protein
MPPPVPGTGLNSHLQPGAPDPMAAFGPGVALVEDKSLAIAYLLWFFLGWIGVHHFYLGKAGRGIGYLLTFAWLTLGWWVDLFTLPAQVKRINSERRAGLR